MRVFFAAALAALALLPGVATAGNANKPPAPSPSSSAHAVALPPDALKRLKSNDPTQIKSALDDVRTSARDGAPAVPTIAALLKQGLSPALTRTAIETLGDTENEGASEVLGWYAHHRDVVLRRAAVEALAKTRGQAASKTLRATLSDPDPAVRGLSATGLGGMKAKEAVPDLFVALDHKVGEAAASIGQLCGAPECDKLASKLGSVPFDVMTSGLDPVLFRPTTEVSDDLKVKIVGRIRELGSAEANRFLKDVQAKWPAGGSQRVRQAIDQAVLATNGSPGSGSAP
jgi:hypothetical protein